MSETFKFIKGDISDDYIISSEKRSNAIVAAFEAGNSSEALSLDIQNNKNFQDKVIELASGKKITIFTRKLDDINFNIIPSKSENTFTGITAAVESVNRESDSGSIISEGCAEKLKIAAGEFSYTANVEGNINWNIGTGSNETSVTVKKDNHSKTMRAIFYATGDVSKRTYVNANGINLTSVMNTVPQSMTEGSDEYVSNYFLDGIKYEKAETYDVADTSNLNVTTSSGNVRPALNYTVNSGYVLSTNGSSATNIVTTMSWNTAKVGTFYVYKEATPPFSSGYSSTFPTYSGDNPEVYVKFNNGLAQGQQITFYWGGQLITMLSEIRGGGYFSISSSGVRRTATALKNISAGTTIAFYIDTYGPTNAALTVTASKRYTKVATRTVEEPSGDKVYPGISVPEDGYIISEDGVLEKATVGSVSANTECYKDPGDRQNTIYENVLYITDDTTTEYYMWDGEATEDEISSDNVLVSDNVFSSINNGRTIVDIKELILSAETVS